MLVEDRRFASPKSIADKITRRNVIELIRILLNPPISWLEPVPDEIKNESPGELLIITAGSHFLTGITRESRVAQS